MHSSIGVIRDLARTSPQAHRYLDLLTELRNALQHYRERLVPPRRKSSGQFLSQIFVLNRERSAPPDSDQDTAPFTPLVAPPELGDESSGAGLWMLQQATEATQGVNDMWRMSDENATFIDPALSGQVGTTDSVPLALGGFDLHWGGISVQGTDSFLFETEPFTGMLDQF